MTTLFEKHFGEYNVELIQRLLNSEYAYYAFIKNYEWYFRKKNKDKHAALEHALTYHIKSMKNKYLDVPGKEARDAQFVVISEFSQRFLAMAFLATGIYENAADTLYDVMMLHIPETEKPNIETVAPAEEVDETEEQREVRWKQMYIQEAKIDEMAQTYNAKCVYYNDTKVLKYYYKEHTKENYKEFVNTVLNYQKEATGYDMRLQENWEYDIKKLLVFKPTHINDVVHGCVIYPNNTVTINFSTNEVTSVQTVHKNGN